MKTPHVYIAKMHTRYPDFHGSGYYNFLMTTDKDELLAKIEDNSHDFSLEGTVTTRHKSIDSVIAKYPTKDALNDKFFKRAENVQV